MIDTGTSGQPPPQRQVAMAGSAGGNQLNQPVSNSSQIGAAMDPINAQRAADGNGGATLYSQGRNMFAPENQGQRWSTMGQSGGSAGGAMLNGGAPGGSWNPPPPPQAEQGVGPYTDPSKPGFQYGVGNVGGVQNQVGPSGEVQGQVNPSAGVDTSRIAGVDMPVSSINPGERYRADAQQAYMDQATSRLDPQWQQREAATRTRLSNMGLTEGSEAWNTEMQNEGQARNDAYAQARNQAIIASGAEAARTQGMDINAGTFTNNATQQNFQNDVTSQQVGNAAAGQQFNQNLQGGAFANQAQNQRFNQNLAGGTFANAAQQQQFAQQAADAATRNSAMSAGGSLLNQRYGTDVGANTQRYATDVGAQTSRDTANIGAQTAISTSAAAGDAANQDSLRRYNLAQQGQDWNQMMQGAMFPVMYQNALMQGQYPTQMPTGPSYPTAPQLPGGNNVTAGQNQNNQNSNLWSAAGNFLGGTGWFGGP